MKTLTIGIIASDRDLSLSSNDSLTCWMDMAKNKTEHGCSNPQTMEQKYASAISHLSPLDANRNSLRLGTFCLSLLFFPNGQYHFLLLPDDWCSILVFEEEEEEVSIPWFWSAIIESSDDIDTRGASLLIIESGVWVRDLLLLLWSWQIVLAESS